MKDGCASRKYFEKFLQQCEKDKLKQLFKLVRFNFEDFKMEVLDLMEIFVEAQNQQNALVSGPEDGATKPEMVEV